MNLVYIWYIFKQDLVYLLWEELATLFQRSARCSSLDMSM